MRVLTTAPCLFFPAGLTWAPTLHASDHLGAIPLLEGAGLKGHHLKGHRLKGHGAGLKAHGPRASRVPDTAYRTGAYLERTVPVVNSFDF